MSAVRILVCACLMLWTCIGLWPASPCEGLEPKFRFVMDEPVVRYPEYLELMMDGEVDVTRGEVSIHLVKAECGWHYLQVLGRLVMAE
ncbi:MAG: hypothetical protein IJ111_02175 [Eggerthellaceae bacterium]|nr:hypothetical protein [Eggerthellaceae bacterium]